ncbi:MAG: cytidylyltransferase domain-containing protein [Bacteroidia bacterium]
METLFLITARGGSKGLPGKNSKQLAGKPLIAYSIEYARNFAKDDCICLSTDDKDIIKIAENSGLPVPFIRPAELSGDTAGSYEVILHALNHYKKQGRTFDTLILLQPTSPFRLKRHLTEALQLYTPGTDMVVSVKKVKGNPYSILFEEGDDGYLRKLMNAGIVGRRQDAPEVYQHNGSIYIMNVKALTEGHFSQFKSVRKYVMEEEYSMDIDTPLDWLWCEFLVANNAIKL